MWNKDLKLVSAIFFISPKEFPLRIMENVFSFILFIIKIFKFLYFPFFLFKDFRGRRKWNNYEWLINYE